MVDIIVQLLKYMGLALIIGGIFGCAVFAMAACMRSSQLSREEEDVFGAPEGASTRITHLHAPNTSGSKLGARVSYQSQSSVPVVGRRLD
jgi:hypothetical protein